MNQVIGVSLGASTIKLVKARLEHSNIQILETKIISHQGNPHKYFRETLELINPESSPVVVTGRKFRNLVKLPTISESEATENAYQYLKSKYPQIMSIASVGAESFIVYSMDETGHIIDVRTKNQCASGTGEFYLQQIRRMDLNLNQAIDYSLSCPPHRVSGRCSVFAKSDCTHALNKGIPKGEVAAGLSFMIADKIKELLHKEKEGQKLIVGGLSLNTAVMKILSQDFDIIIPEESNYFEALGAAIYGLKYQIENRYDISNIFNEHTSSFSFHQPLATFSNLVNFKTADEHTTSTKNEFVLGLDVGSTTTKAVLIDTLSKQIVSKVYLYTHGNPIGASKKCYKALLEKLPKNSIIIGLGTTGSGRHIAGLHAQTTAIFNEIIAHATAAIHYDPDVDTIFEIGGQDAKYTYIINKVPADYAMNEACSAGTGSFIEESAFETLGYKVHEIQDIALMAPNPPNFSDQCAAFISSDIKTALQEGISKENIIAGLTYSICMNYINRVKGNRPVGNKILMQGGVCYNKAIPTAMAALTGKEIIVPPDPGLMGAFGVALETLEKIELGLLERNEFDLQNLINRNVEYLEPFVCNGGKEKCDLGCQINLIKINEKKYPFGGACNKYYNLIQHKKVDSTKYDLVKTREEIIFQEAKPYNTTEKRISIGINNSFHTNTLFPLFYGFFTKLGFNVVLSDKFDERGYQRENTSFCFPAQLSLGLFQNLLDKNCDYYFVPNIYEMYVKGSENDRLDFNSTCVFVQGEPLFLKQAFKDYDLDGKLLTPKFNFAKGWNTQTQQFIELANQIGVYDEKLIIDAYQYGCEQLQEVENKLQEIGNQFLRNLESNPKEFAIVLIGRNYNSFSEFANKGIPQKVASRGITIIPYDMLPYMDEEYPDSMYWEAGKKILKATNFVKKHPQLYPLYITNFSCGPDSLIITTFREMMGSKPSLTLELDSHSADAGINTRLDAFIDIIQNNRKAAKVVSRDSSLDFKICDLISINGLGYIQTPGGKQIPLNSPNVKLLIPSMGDLAAPLFAAALRSLGFNAIALPEATNRTLQLGRSVSTGKECLPLILLAGGLLEWMQDNWNGSDYVAFFNVQGAGNCRLGQYPVFLRHLIRRKKWDKVAQMTLMNEDGFAGFGEDFAVRGIQAIMASDVIDDVRSGILTLAKDPEKGLKYFDDQFKELIGIMEEEPKYFIEALKEFAKRIKENIPAAKSIEDADYIAILGEIYVRRDGFSHKWLNKYFAKRGFIAKIAYITEWIFYVDYLIDKHLLEPEESFRNKIERRIRHNFMKRLEKKIKNIMTKTGYYKYEGNHIKKVMNNSTHIIPLDYKGEPGIVLGGTLTHGLTDYAGIINIGPFACMPTRITEAIALPELTIEAKERAMRNSDTSFKMSDYWNGKMHIPFLTIETDGNPFPQIIDAKLEAFVLQAKRAARLMKKSKKNHKNIKEQIFENN